MTSRSEQFFQTVIAGTHDQVKREMRIRSACDLKIEVISPHATKNFMLLALGLLETWFIIR